MSPNNTCAVKQNNHEGRRNGEDIDQKHRQLPEKKFEVRNSLLTDLFETNRHIKTVHHMFIATLMCLFVNAIANDYLKKEEIKIGLHLILSTFGKLYVTIFSWMGSCLMTFFCYMCFVFWAKVRINFPPKSNNLKVWDSLWLLSLIVYYIFSLYLASSIVTIFQLPPGSAAIILLEEIRYVMKVHAFVRSNVPNVLRHKPHSDQDLILPKFSKFLYFLFAPTIVYRDNYPRTQQIRWKFVMYRLLEIAGVIFYYSFLVDKFLIPTYADFGLRKITWSELIISILENTIVGMVMLLSGFFLVLHSVQNLFGELLRFGDRMFYKDWWTCTSYSEYFRTWNVVVHDWLYTYVYKDMYEIVAPRKKNLAKFTVFILSAVVHEWVLTYMFGFFFPALFMQFLFGGALLSWITAPKVTVLNVLFWYGLAFGSGNLVSVYTLEYFARKNVPIDSKSLRDYLLPRWLTCDCIE